MSATTITIGFGVRYILLLNSVMFSPLVVSWKVRDVNGNVELAVENLRNASSKVPLFRALEIELAGRCIYKSETKGSVGAESTKQTPTSLLEGCYVIHECSYKIITAPNSTSKEVKISLGSAMLGKAIKIPMEGTSIIKGAFPFIVPYVRYTVLCEVQASHTDFSFKSVQLLGLTMHGTMRNSDLKYVLQTELQLGHLYNSFVDECARNMQNALLCKKTRTTIVEVGNVQQKMESEIETWLREKAQNPKTFDRWDPRFLSVQQDNSVIYEKNIKGSTWYKLKLLSNVISAFPNLAYFLLNNLKMSTLLDIQKLLLDKKKNWHFLLFPLTLAKVSPMDFVKLFMDSYGNAFKCGEISADCNVGEAKQMARKCLSWMKSVEDLPINRRVTTFLKGDERKWVVPVAFNQLVKFYKREVVDNLMCTGSTMITLSDQTLCEQLRSNSYNKLFGARGLNPVLELLQTSNLIHKVHSPNLMAMLTPLFPEHSLSTLSFKDLPRLSYALQTSWTCVNEIIKRLSSMWIESCRKRMRLLNTLICHPETATPTTMNTKTTTNNTIGLEDDHGTTCSNLLFASETTSNKMKDRLQENGTYIFKKRKRGRGTKGVKLTEGNTGNVDEDDVYILTPAQTNVLLASLMHPFVIVVGTPGTGKTLTIEAIFDLYTNENGEDIGKVAVVTQGGCMADELEKRGLFRAKTIHAALRDRFTPSESADLRSFDYEKVTVLVIDEFSNVTDDLASRIYSPECFPNLETIIHVFDPLQTGPIGLGSLSTDYMQTLKTLEIINSLLLDDLSNSTLELYRHGILEKLTAYKLMISIKRAQTKDLASTTILCWKLSLAYLKHVKKSKRAEEFIVEQNKILSKLAPFGVCLYLSRIRRANRESLMATNDTILRQGCKQPFVFDDVSFMQFYCDTISTHKNVQRLKYTHDHPTTVSKAKGTVKDVLECTPIGRHIVKHMEVYALSGSKSKDTPQYLTLTNDDCKTINTMCDYVYSLYYHMRDLPSNSEDEQDIDVVIQDVPRGDHTIILPAMYRGAKVLVRENKPKMMVTCKVLPNKEALADILKYCMRNLEVCKCMVVKPSDYMNCKAVGEVEDEDFVEENLEDVDEFLKIDVMDKFRRDLESDLEMQFQKLRSSLEHLQNIECSAIYNGTSFKFWGVVDLCTKPLERNAVLRRLKDKQELLADTMLSMLAGCKGKGSKSAKKDIRRNFLFQHQKLFNVDYICKMVTDMELKRWRSPYENKSSLLNLHHDRDAVISDMYVKSERPEQIYGSEGWRRLLVGENGIVLAMGKDMIPMDLLQPGWAITVNLSQGKEYKETVLVIPKHRYEKSVTLQAGAYKVPLLHTTLSKFDRSHIHVAITRHKKRFSFFGDKIALQDIAARNSESLSNRFTLMIIILRALVDWQNKEH